MEDRNEEAAFAVGKQRNSPAGLFYTGASGIWQTVWMEPVPAAHIDKLDITPDLASFSVTSRVSGATDQRAEVVVTRPGGGRWWRAHPASRATTLRLMVPYSAPVDTRRPVPLRHSGPAGRRRAGRSVDEVSSYGGLRTIGP